MIFEGREVPFAADSWSSTSRTGRESNNDGPSRRPKGAAKLFPTGSCPDFLTRYGNGLEYQLEAEGCAPSSFLALAQSASAADRTRSATFSRPAIRF